MENKIVIELKTETELQALLECLKAFNDVKYNGGNGILANVFNSVKQAKNNLVQVRIDKLKAEIKKMESQKLVIKEN